MARPRHAYLLIGAALLLTASPLARAQQAQTTAPADTVRDLGTGTRVGRAAELQAPERLVAVVRTTTSQADGEQAYITLFEGGAASGLVVVSFEGGRLFGTTIPDTWTWLDEDTIEICGSINTLRNDLGFEPVEHDCGTIPVTGKELDLDGDGDGDLIETLTILHPDFYLDRPGGGPGLSR